MRIAILTSGILPVPAVQGGAVEALIDHVLEYNARHKLHDITVYSVFHPSIKGYSALRSDANHYHYIDTSSLLAKTKSRLHGLLHRHTYYHHSIDYFFHQSLKSILRQEFDVIVVENRPGYVLELRGRTKAKLVCHLHNDFLNCATLYGKDLYQSFSKILVVSDYIKARVQTCNPHDSKTVTIHNGIDLTLFSAASSMSRESSGWSKDDFVLVFSGRLIPEKGIKELIEAMHVLKSHPDIKLLVMGNASFANDNQESVYVIKLKELAAELGGRVRFTGYVKHELTPCYLRLADVAVVPSVWDDPFPTTVLEAEAMGLPIISTRRGGIPEEVAADNAILLDTDEHFVKSLADAILTLYQDEKRRKYMGKVSAALSGKYSKEIYAKNFFHAIQTSFQE